MSLIILLLFLLVGCQTNSGNENSLDTMENGSAITDESDINNLTEFEGLIADKIEENGKEKVLVVKGITEEEAKSLSFYEITGKVDHDDIIWFRDNKDLFKEINIGEKVNVLWDSSVPYGESSIITVTAVELK